MLSFILGVFFGSLLFFMARIANVKLETILAHYTASQSMTKPIILMPEEPKKQEPTTLEEALKQALEE
jgi:hypothetical protein